MKELIQRLLLHSKNGQLKRAKTLLENKMMIEIIKILENCIF